MNPKIEKLKKEIEKTEGKIADMQDKLRALETQKTELDEFLKTRQMAPEKEVTQQEQEGRNED